MNIDVFNQLSDSFEAKKKCVSTLSELSYILLIDSFIGTTCLLPQRFSPSSTRAFKTA